MSHFYRGELSRSMVGRQRLDATTTWAITTTSTICTVAFSLRDVPHLIFFFNLAVVSVMLWIEARRYRFYDAYRARVRNAVREVEDAMVKLAGLAERMRDTRAAGAGYLESFEAARIRERAGLANRIEVENARRTRLAADAAIAALDYEAVIAWIVLYRAVGGGWDGRQDTGTASAMPSMK